MKAQPRCRLRRIIRARNSAPRLILRATRAKSRGKISKFMDLCGSRGKGGGGIVFRETPRNKASKGPRRCIGPEIRGHTYKSARGLLERNDGHFFRAVGFYIPRPRWWRFARAIQWECPADVHAVRGFISGFARCECRWSNRAIYLAGGPMNFKLFDAGEGNFSRRIN